ncbi:hypothetical protein DL96DRAFT_1670520 [Flagelloscypha sp. PMI_526]|nr:hypothetical protein DL96DRAFT_1670520 [Flagelloscypha sp. PMI_526]
MIASGSHNSTKLTPPGLPNPMPNLNPTIQVNTAVPGGASIQVPSSFLGFSIEISVANQVLGHNSSLIQVPFLNLAHNIDYATVDMDGTHPELANKILWKDYANRKSQNPTETPPVYLSLDFFRLLRNISSLTNVHWYLGIPFNDTNWRLGIVEKGQEIQQTSRTFTASHGHRDQSYTPDQWMVELRSLVDTMAADPKYAVANTQIIVPSIANSNGWTLEGLWEKGLVDQFNNNIKYLAAEQYPDNNCCALWPSPTCTVPNPQDIFPAFLSHEDHVKKLVAGFLPSTLYAQSKGKPFLMFETNTASCGGFPGISDSFGAALWALDYGLQMAYGNFSGAMFHVGGQTYPFTAAPTNETTFHQWTVGSVYYATLVMAEALGTSNTSQLLDLNANDANPSTPAYAIYENALFNYMDKASGAAEVTFTFSIGGTATNEANGTPQNVQVKYLVSNSVADKGNFTWAGQTFGDAYHADGRLKGTEDVQTVTCGADNTCQVKVPAPGFALVFLAGNPNPQAAYPSQTFATTAVTQTRNTAQVAPEQLATSNGHQDVAAKKYSTSFGSGNGKNATLSQMVVESGLSPC